MMIAGENNQYDIGYPGVWVTEETIYIESDKKMYSALMMGYDG